MTPITDDFGAIRAAMRPSPAPDLPALLREIEHIDAHWPKTGGEEEDRVCRRLDAIMDVFRDTVVSDLVGALAQAEYLEKYLDDHDGVDPTNAPIVRSLAPSCAAW